jgi:pyruvate dehydrogenase E1 component alpha subunit
MHDVRYECLRIRRVEEAIANEYHKLEMRQPVHLDIGAEWASVAVCSQLKPHDKVFGGHRSHSQFLACGGKDSLKELIAGLMGKNDLSSMHLSSDGIFVASGSIVGGMIPVAVGAALARKLKGTAGIVVCFLGDGATEEGICAESLSLSVLWELPILFVVQNNKLAVTTPIEDRHKYDISEVAKAYGLEAHNYLSCRVGLGLLSDSVIAIIDRVRLGKPSLIEFDVERKMVHCGIDVERELKHDVLEGYSVDESAIDNEIKEAFEFARNSPEPTEVRAIYAN